MDGYVNIASGYELSYISTQSGFGTGTVVNVTNTGTTVESYTIIIFGDVNGDGNIDSIDAGKIVDFENNALHWDPTTDAAFIKAGDVNGDRNVDSMDAGTVVDVENGRICINQSTGMASSTGCKAEITSFSLNGAVGIINETEKTIRVVMPSTTDLTALVPTIIHLGTSISPASGVAQNFTSPVIYTVTAYNSAKQDYTVTVASGDYTSANIRTLKYVPAGSFQLDATGTNISTISTAFRMSQYEITRAQFLAMMGTDHSNTTSSSGLTDPVQTVNWYHAIAFCNKLSIAEGLTPVYSVTISGVPVDFATLAYANIPTISDAAWNAVIANWSANGYRLPTEMEWIWAAMGADTANPGQVNTTIYLKAFAGSTGSNSIGDYAVFGYNDYPKNDGQTTTQRSNPVGSKLANELGLYDMSGNVSEWCWDRWTTYPPGILTDYRGPASGSWRLRHGGSWNDNALSAHFLQRVASDPSRKSDNSGFRVVRN